MPDLRLHHPGRALVMGILNTTPDSFSDGGRFDRHEAALSHAVRLAEEGADIIDIGGESTRPGAEPVSLEQELDRVIPVIESVVSETGLPVSIDSSKPGVMKAAVAAGAAMINDVYALRQDGALEMAASLGVPVCLMHMQGEPRVMQSAPSYDDVVKEVTRFLHERASECIQAGIPSEDIVIDPGFGFGKTLQHNRQLFSELASLCDVAWPVLVGVSRKSMLGALTGRDTGNRMAASVAAAVIAQQRGARILRVHDVAETVDALTVASALE